MKIKLLVLITLTIIAILPVKAMATEKNIDIASQLKDVDTGEMDDFMGTEFSFTFTELAKDIMSGTQVFSPSLIINRVIKSVFSEIFLNIALIRNLILIAILSSMLTNMSSSFTKTDVSQLAFFMCYLGIITILYNSFSIAYEVSFELVNGINSLVIASIPIIASTSILSGNPTYVSTFNPIILFFSDLVILFMRNFIMPLILGFASLEIINNITKIEVLGLFAKTGRQALSWILKSISIFFITILSLQRMTAPIMDGFVSKTAKLSVSALPVVGGVLSGAVDTVLYLGKITKNGSMSAIIIITIIFISVYFIKLISFILIYKMVAIAIEPMGDKRIAKSVSIAGDYVGYLLSACGVTTVMFLFALIMVISL